MAAPVCVTGKTAITASITAAIGLDMRQLLLSGTAS
jgi:hypothetical protein